MFTAFIIVTVLTAAANAYAAIVDFQRPQWVLDNMTKWGGSHSWLFTLGVLKAAGALGLLAGIGVPLIGGSRGRSGVAFCWRYCRRLVCWLVPASSLASDLSPPGDWVACFAARSVVKACCAATRSIF